MTDVSGAWGPYALMTPAEMQAADAATIEAGIPSMVLMERAGKAVADHAVALMHDRGLDRSARVTVLCGPGNNGGDGYVAARILAAEGYQVRVIATAAVTDSASDAATAALAWQGPIEQLSATADATIRSGAILSDPDLVIDAVYGAGLSRAVDGRVAALLEALGSAACLRLAVDMPSGLDGESGQVRGIAVRSDATVTFHRLKPGHLLYPGHGYCGTLHVADIGITRDADAAANLTLWQNAPALFSAVAAGPAPDAHKYSRGLVIAVGGRPWQTGAIRLTARSALRAGAGLVKIASPKDALPIHAAHLTAVMLEEANTAKDLSAALSDARISAVVFGPGAGTDRSARGRLNVCLRTNVPLVLDADALTLMADEPEAMFKQIAGREAPTFLTPHEGEFRRLFPKITEISQRSATPVSKADLARAAADQSGAIVIYKGPDTVIAAPDGRAVINTHASAGLATAGSGDVLAGVLTGLLSQRLRPFECACASVWLHGDAALRGGRGLIAEDLVELLPMALQGLDAGMPSEQGQMKAPAGGFEV